MMARGFDRNGSASPLPDIMLSGGRTHLRQASWYTSDANQVLIVDFNGFT